jgi:hypothetical protein
MGAVHEAKINALLLVPILSASQYKRATAHSAIGSHSGACKLSIDRDQAAIPMFQNEEALCHICIALGSLKQ